MTKKQNPSNISTISTKRRELQYKGDQILEEIAVAGQNEKTPSADVTSDQTPRYANAALNKIFENHQKNSDCNVSTFFNEVCSLNLLDDDNLKEIATQLQKNSSTETELDDKKLQLLSLVDFLKDPEAYLENRKKQNPQQNYDSLYLKIINIVNAELKEFLIANKYESLKQKVLKIIEDKWSKHFNTTRPPNTLSLTTGESILIKGQPAYITIGN
jgi:hypothetical protein